MFKENFREYGSVSTNPTEQGRKDLDLFHPNYRVKQVLKRKIKDLLTEGSDLFLDILQCEKAGLVEIYIENDIFRAEEFKQKMESMYMVNSEQKESWNLMRCEVIRMLLEETLKAEIVRELREELRE